MKAINDLQTVWLLMLLLTFSSYFLGEQGYQGAIPALLLLLAAAVKGYFIIHDFMDLKGVSLVWQIIMYGWLLSICTTIAICYILSI